MARSFSAALPACLLVLLGGGVWAASLSQTSLRGARAADSASTHIYRQGSAQEASDDSSARATSSSPEGEPTAEFLLEVFFWVFLLGPLLAVLLGLLFAVPAVLLAVSLVMEGGCLRALLFGLGWLCAIIYGLLFGAIVGDAILGLEFLAQSLVYLFMWGYPVAAYWGHHRLSAMTDEQYRAWDQTLTGGALFGFGAASLAGMVRSAAGGFGGFGGGSFGGGGASGSWSGATGAAAGPSSAALAAGRASGDNRGGLARLRRWARKFQWYHGLAFVLVALVFVPLGLGTVQALQNPTVLGVVLAGVVVYGGYKLWRRPAVAAATTRPSSGSFQGGEASSSWS